jgi:Ran GTPase-activating protein (RanGAP) involved in mRNA processing and transport
MKTRRTSDASPTTPATQNTNSNSSTPLQATMTSSAPTVKNRQTVDQKRARYGQARNLPAYQRETDIKKGKIEKQGGVADIPQAPKPENRWDKFTKEVTAEGDLTLLELSESDMSELTAWLRTSPAALVRLGIYKCDVGDAGAAALADALQVNTTLTSLKLYFNKIGSDGAVALAGALKVNKTLTSFAFDLNIIGDAGGAALADALQFNVALKKLHLEGNGIGDAGMAAIANSLRGNTTLTSLYVDGDIETEAAAALADTLENNTTLDTLHLCSNGMFPDEAIAIVDSLKFNKTLTAFHFWGGRLSDNVALAFADVLKLNKTLATLNLNQNNFGDEAAVMLSDALKINSTLGELNIRSNKISIVGALALVGALDHNETLTTINRDFFFAGHADIDRRLNQKLQRNRDLKLKPYAEASLDLIFKHSPVLREVGMPTELITVLAPQLSTEVLSVFEQEWRDAFRAPPPPITTTTTNTTVTTTTTTTTDPNVPTTLITSPAPIVTSPASVPPVSTQPTATAADIKALLADPSPVVALSRWIDGHANPTAALNWVDPSNGYTLLHYAVAAQEGGVVRSLLARPIDRTRADQNNQTAAQLAQRLADSSSSSAVAAIAALFK